MSDDGILRSELLSATPGIEHGFETVRGDLGAVLGLRPLRLRQVHGAHATRVEDHDSREALLAEAIAARPEGDALVTSQPDALVTVATADCVPVLIAEPEAGVVAAAHAGWRGVALGILPTTVAVMAREHGARPERCRAAIGPRVGADAYRVGADVRTALRAAGVSESVFLPAPADEDGREGWWCDLGAAAEQQLGACGLPVASIDRLDYCTVRDAGDFWSYRRQGEAAGRMLSGIRLGAREGS